MQIKEKINKVNKILEDGENENITENKFGGFTQTGYEPQFVVDAMNDVFGIDGWGFVEMEDREGTISSGKEEKLYFSSRVQVWISIDDKKYSRTAWGGSSLKGSEVGNAKKSAQTDALKKALSYFGIGNKAYRGELSLSGKSKIRTGKKSTKHSTKSTNDNVYTITSGQRRKVFALGKELGWDSQETKNIAKDACKVDSFNNITLQQAKDLIDLLSKRIEKNGKNVMSEATRTFSEDIDPKDIPESLDNG